MSYLDDKINKSCEALRLAAKMSMEYYKKPLIITYSGGKDSDVMLHLALKCLPYDSFEVMNSHTTVDAPETVYHIREVFDRLKKEGIKASVHMPVYKGERTTMWRLIVDMQMPPTRIARYCCTVLKEASASNRFITTGVRGGESIKRRWRGIFENRASKDRKKWGVEHVKEVYKDAHAGMGDVWDCKFITLAKQNKDLICNPIYEWTESDIWTFINDEKIETCALYERGYHRVGCIGCPMAGCKNMKKEFSDYPKYKDAYIRAFNRMVEARKMAGKDDTHGHWVDGKHVMQWWLNDKNWMEGQYRMDFETGKITDEL